MRRPRYSNLDPAHLPRGTRDVFRWAVWDRLLGRRRIAAPGPPAPRVRPDLELVHRSSGPPRLTWIGHASFLGTLDGASFLIDPVFSPRVGGVVRRHVPPGLVPADLPHIDAVLVTHNHYDHLDASSIGALPRDVPVFVPLGLGRWLRRRGLSCVRELDWWESATSGRLKLTLVPARHWSRRSLGDVNSTLWGGWVVEAGAMRVYHAGDTGWFGGFTEIGRRFPGLLAAMLPIGAYSPAWFMESNHMNPEQAGRAFLELGARHLVPMHWGTFQLTDEPLAEPAERLSAWWRGVGPEGLGERMLHVPAVGQTLALDG